MKSSHLNWLRRIALAGTGLFLLLVFALACTFVYVAPTLPTAETMRSRQLTVPLRVLTRDGKLISQIGEQRRIPVNYEDLPPVVVHAVLAAEDDGFFQHSGVDWMSLLRAVLVNLKDLEFSEGGSTITQQAARNMFLSLDKHLRRKAAELFVTWRMEHDFTKEEILATYLNVINFGQRSYGIAAAAETYYGKKLPELTVAQAATLAGIIQRPSTSNPVKDPAAAEARRHYVLGRMAKLGYIDKATAEAAEKEPIGSRRFALLTDVDAPYVAEAVRQYVVQNYGADAVNAGLKVYTSIDADKQAAADMAVRKGLMDYDHRHGYRGRIGKVDLPANPSGDELEDRLARFKPVANLVPAVVTRVADATAEVYVRDQGMARIAWEDMSWTRPSGAAHRASDVMKRGDVVFVVPGKQPGNVQLSQMPQAQAALVALDPRDGGILAMVGGFDFYTSAFNRVTQAHRQPGSGFKPFLYSAALENGFTPASVIYDMPLVTDYDSESEEIWRPENSGGDFNGPMPLREALVNSRNLVSARILQRVGVDTVIDYASRFGFDPATLPRNLTLALGTQIATPLQMATGYAVFANGGFKVDPYLITRVEDSSGKVLFEAEPKIACPSCEEFGIDGSDVPEDRRAPRVISAQNAWLTSDILHDVATRGTGRRTNALGRDDLAGKTGTTQYARDNWFNGFNSNVVATAWVGFDDERSLGEREEGSSTAVPLWMYFMAEALEGTPSARMPRPEGIVDINVSSTTGEPTDASDPNGHLEVFMEGHLPGQLASVQDTTAPGVVPAAVGKPASSASGEVLF